MKTITTNTTVYTSGTANDDSIYFFPQPRKIKMREWKQYTKKYFTLYARAWKVLAK